MAPFLVACSFLGPHRLGSSHIYFLSLAVLNETDTIPDYLSCCWTQILHLYFIRYLHNIPYVRNITPSCNIKLSVKSYLTNVRLHHYYRKPDRYSTQYCERCDPNTNRLSILHVTQPPNNTASYPDEHDHA